MWPCCCSYLMCADVRGETSTSHSEEEQSNVRMDIALLKEQYNSIRDKQRRQTQVLCFNRAQNPEDTNGKDPVDVFPVCQVKRPPLTRAAAVEFAGGPWRTHLDTHRLTHTAPRLSSSEASSSSSESSHDSSHRKNAGAPAWRKMSAPAVLSRQQSFGSYRSTPAGAKYYPFPQRKCPRKSEAARRLGLYASL